jgi:hypothetical protein
MTTETIACVVQVRLQYETTEDREYMLNRIKGDGACYLCGAGPDGSYSAEITQPARPVPAGLAERLRATASCLDQFSMTRPLLEEAADALEVGKPTDKATRQAREGGV